MQHRFQKIVFALSFLIVLTISTAAQSAVESSAGKVSKQTLKSALMKREMPYNIYLPKAYADKSMLDQKFPVIYLLHGLTGSFENWSQKTELEKHASVYPFIIVMPDGANGWYTDSATQPDDKYESFLIKELIPEIESKFRAKASRENRAIAGTFNGWLWCDEIRSKISCKLCACRSFSGALGITDITDKIRSRGFRPRLWSVYGAADSKTRLETIFLDRPVVAG